ncbi:MAG: AbrB/MazE/SpoVT family DNA-binding domain-containing protein [Thermoleophilaceae bacterium]|nr:AbrB/MazE/SpoVT family DNA-binding domain-containing protein [Thermoleophilaceae bacterium]
MGSARIYKKGQVTIPKAVREATGLHVGDRVVVEARSDEVVVRRARGVLEFEPPPPADHPLSWPEARRAMRAERTARHRSNDE